MASLSSPFPLSYANKAERRQPLLELLMSKPHITTARGYLIVMDIAGSLYVLGSDAVWHSIFCPCGVKPYYFDGSECVTADCLPSWGCDAYYLEKLPQSFANSSRS